MAISLAKGKAAIGTLKNGGAGRLFDAIKGSKGYVFSKHLNKRLALEAAQTESHENPSGGEKRKGYFKRRIKHLSS